MYVADAGLSSIRREAEVRHWGARPLPTYVLLTIAFSTLDQALLSNRVPQFWSRFVQACQDMTHQAGEATVLSRDQEVAWTQFCPALFCLEFSLCGCLQGSSHLLSSQVLLKPGHQFTPYCCAASLMAPNCCMGCSVCRYVPGA